ncbi:MAG: YlbF family regulator [Gemmatimonadota bacterium]|nr:YlbF family regulator [Gemmatimonadota bacterium]
MGIEEKAYELGQALARTDEYQALKRAMDAADEDRELVELRSRLQALEQRLEGQVRAGQEPEEDAQKAYMEAAEELQVKAGFQRLISAQANFEKIMMKTNEIVARGIEEGARSRIIVP